jgi:hypothetical protein
LNPHLIAVAQMLESGLNGEAANEAGIGLSVRNGNYGEALEHHRVYVRRIGKSVVL